MTIQFAPTFLTTDFFLLSREEVSLYRPSPALKRGKMYTIMPRYLYPVSLPLYISVSPCFLSFFLSLFLASLSLSPFLYLSTPFSLYFPVPCLSLPISLSLYQYLIPLFFSLFLLSNLIPPSFFISLSIVPLILSPCIYSLPLSYLFYHLVFLYHISSFFLSIFTNLPTGT